jgi:hypothetical protein
MFNYISGHLTPGFDFMTTKIFATGDKGRAWFVDPNAQSVVNNGKTPKKAFTTMEQAFDKVASGDIIYFVGKLDEQLVTPAQVFDVTVVGCGNRPRHADSTPSGGQYAASQWGAASGDDGTATVQVIQQGWRFVNILFTAKDATAAMVNIVRNAASGNSERDGSHAELLGCRFAGAGLGIKPGATSYTENTFNVLVQGCKFNGCTTAIDSTGGFANHWTLLDNFFVQNTNHIDVGFDYAVIKGNVFGQVTTLGVDLTGGSNNVVTGNYFYGDFNVLNVAGTNDMWAGNFAEETGGVTDADPTGS